MPLAFTRGFIIKNCYRGSREKQSDFGTYRTIIGQELFATETKDVYNNRRLKIFGEERIWKAH